MKKESNFPTMVIVNMVILALVALNKTYRPILDKLAKQYIKLKGENLSNDDKKPISKMFEEAKIKIGNLGNLVNETLTTHNIQETTECTLSGNVQKYLVEKFTVVGENDLLNLENPTLAIAGISSDIIDSTCIEERNIENANNIHVSFLKEFVGAIAVVITLNSFGISDKVQRDFSIMTDLDDLFDDIQGNILENKSDSLIYHKTNVIAPIYITNEEKWNRNLELGANSLDLAMETILKSDADSEEKLHFIIQTGRLTTEQKIWYALLLADISFSDVFQSLLTIDGTTQDQIIQDIIKCDMVSFQTLFDAILQLDGLTNEQLTKYLSFYHADYNTVTLTDTINYVLEHENFTYEEKLTCIWNLLDKYSLDDKIQFILDFYQITYEDYLNLYNINKEEFDENEHIIFDLFKKVNVEKEKFALGHYDFDSSDAKNQLETVNAIVAAEGAYEYKDLYGVANVIFNRTTKPSYAIAYGTNPYLQVTAKNQFAVYASGAYRYYLSDNPQYAAKYALAQQAVLDALYNGYKKAHNYTEFRSNGTVNFSDNLFAPNGNRYGAPMDESTRIDYKNLHINEFDGKHPKIKI